MNQGKSELSVGPAVGWGVLAAVAVTAIMLPMVMAGLLPIEKPFAAVFADSLLGEGTPLPVGVGLHLLYVSFWSAFYLLTLRAAPVVNATLLASGLWIVQAVVFYPLVGWGFLGTAVSISTGLVTLIPHIIFALVLGTAGYILNRYYQQ